MTDIDGTISPIALTPEAAAVDQRCRSALQILAAQLDIVAAISGRGAADARSMVGIDGMVYIGNHGLEEWSGGETRLIDESVPFVDAIARVVEETRSSLTIPGLIYENKGPTASIHYRLAPHPEQASEHIRAILEPLAAREGLRLTTGRMVWEIRPPIGLGKGAAAERLVLRHSLRGVIFLGDDMTDVNAFERLAALRQVGAIEALNVGVLADETPAQVVESTDVQVVGVDGIATLLQALAGL